MILYRHPSDEENYPLAPFGPNSDSFTLVDANGNRWDVGVQNTGLLQTAPSTRASVTVILNSQDNLTSWLLGVTTSGLLTTTAISFLAGSPTLRWMGSVTGASVWGLGVLDKGQLFTEQSPAIFEETSVSFLSLKAW
jgi:hypothetical protein